MLRDFQQQAPRDATKQKEIDTVTGDRVHIRGDHRLEAPGESQRSPDAEAIPDSILHIGRRKDREGRYLPINEAFGATTGIAREVTEQKTAAEEPTRQRKRLEKTVARLRAEIRRRKETEKALKESEGRYESVRRAEEQILALSRLVLEIERAQDFQEALEVCLESALHITGMRGGAAYTVNTVTGDLELVCSRGSVKGFKKVVSTGDVDARWIRRITLGDFVYENNYDMLGLAHWFNMEEAATQIAILPALYEGRLTACIFMASPVPNEPTGSTPSVLEVIAAHVKGGLARIWAEEIATKTVEKYWALIDGAPDAILLADTDGIILETNRKVEEIFGYEKEESLGRDFCDLLRPLRPKRVKQEFRKLLDLGSIPLALVYMTTKDGRRVPVSVTASVVDFGGRKLAQAIFRDETELKEASKALRRSDKKYHALMDKAGDAIILVSLDGKIIEVNKKTVQLLGYRPEELLGMDFSRFHSGSESKNIVGLHERGSADGYVGDSLATRKDGTPVPVDLMWSKIVVSGTPITQVIMRDISQRKTAEEALKESETRYRTVFENTGTAMVICEIDMTISLVNSEFERMSGFSRTEIEGVRRWSDFIHERTQQTEYSPLRCISSDGRTFSLRSAPAAGPQSFRTVIAGKSGSTTPVLVSIAPLPGSGRSIASLIDISQLVYAEHVLQQSEERYRALVQQSSEGIFIVEPKTEKLVEANEPFMNMLGYDVDDIQNLFLYDLIMESKSFTDTSVAKALRNGHYFMGERNFRGKNGLVIDVDVAASVVSYANATFIMMSFRDITEKKRMEQALRQAQKMEAIGTLAGGISHDFNNMLQVIAGCAYQLRKKLKEKENEQLVDLAEQVLSSSEKASQLTRSILTFSRKQQIDPKPIDVNTTIKSAEKFLKRIIGEEIEFVPEYSPDNLLIIADQVQIEQILMNVATNARDAMPGGGFLRITASLEEIGEQFVRSRGYGTPGAYACIAVADSGAGMDEETKRRMFEPFYTTKKPGKGTGLGMAVVYGIVKQHNGYIDVESQPGKGTMIKVYFPLAAVTHPEGHAVEENGPAAGGTETILLAEDEKDVRAFLKGILEEAGYGVIEAENGEDALEQYAMHKDQVQLALLDVVMPKKDGRQAYGEMRRLKRSIKAIFMSGYSEHAVHRKGILGMGTPLLSKPVSPALLLSKIRETLDL